MRAAMLNEYMIVINVIMVESLDFLPNLVAAELVGDIGDYWSDEEFIKPNDPRHPNYIQPE